MAKKLTVGVLGAGRIGQVHIQNISMFVKEMKIKTVADPYLSKQAEEFIKDCGIENATTDIEEIFSDPEIEVVLVCTPSNTHAEMVKKAAKAGKNVFCEKPVDYNIESVKEVLAVVKEAGVKFQIGFNRRFDHNHRAVYEAVHSGKIGDPHIIRISSRDPAPPTIEYVRSSGGIFYDMMIHDFDMVRFLAGSEAVEVSTAGAVLVDPAIGEAGDVDTAVVTIKFENGAIGVIDNSRQAVYGYDQRIEVFGSKGCVTDDNDLPNNVTVTTADVSENVTTYKVMWDRYTQAFIAEMKAFADAIVNDKTPEVTDLDGLYPVLMAAAATKSLKENRPVKISEVDV